MSALLARIRRAWPVLRWLVAIGLVGAAAWVLNGQRSELSNFGDELLAHWWWLLPAAVLEGASLCSFAGMQRRLLSVAGIRAPLRPMIAVTLAAQAINNSVPAGPVVAAVYGFRWYRRFGADEAVALWTLVGTSISAILSLALLTACGVALATGLGASLGLIPVVIGVLAVTAGVAVLYLYQRPLAAVAHWVLRVSQRIFGRPRGDLEGRIERFVARLTVARLDWPSFLRFLAYGLGNWLADCGCFAFSFLVVGAGVPWKGLLLAYGAGQLAANLPITPGGLGAVEGSITVALTYFGGAQVASLEAVLVYRLVSFWAELVVGWSSAGVMAVAARRGRWPLHSSDLAPALAEGAGPPEGTPSTVAEG